MVQLRHVAGVAETSRFSESAQNNALVLQPGVVRLFGGTDIGDHNKRLGHGWADPEEGHIWSDGEEAVLPIAIAETPSMPLTLSIQGSPFIKPSHAVQHIALFGNGFRLGAWRLTELLEYSLDAVIEPEQWWSRGTLSYVKCVWHLPDCTAPVDHGVRDDYRRLGFCFRSIGLNQRTA